MTCLSLVYRGFAPLQEQSPFSRCIFLSVRFRNLFVELSSLASQFSAWFLITMNVPPLPDPLPVIEIPNTSDVNEVSPILS